MATFVVTNTNDSGAGSLRDAVAQANSTAGDNTISFAIAAGSTITLTSGQLVLTNNMTIDGDLNGDGDADIILSGGDTQQLVLVRSGDVTLNSLVLTDGHSVGNQFQHSAVLVRQSGSLTMNYCTVQNCDTGTGEGVFCDLPLALAQNNSFQPWFIAAPILNEGILRLNNSIITNNTSIGRDYTSSFVGLTGYAAAGAIGTIGDLSAGRLYLTHTLMFGNSAVGGDGGPTTTGGGAYGGNAAGTVFRGEVEGTALGVFNSASAGTPGTGQVFSSGNYGKSNNGMLKTYGSYQTVILGNELANNVLGIKAGEVGNGLGGADVITGEAGSAIYGGAGNDTMTSGGPSKVVGGMGNDTIFTTAVAGGIWDGGLGTDTINFSALGFTGVALDLRSGSFAVNGATFSGFENIVGSSGSNGIFGSSSANRLDGGEGDDIIAGMEGGDTLIGGGGTDTLWYFDSDAAVTVNMRFGFVFGGHANGDTVSGFENVAGSSFKDVMTGSTLANILSGFAGSDRLIGGGGSDTLVGGTGIDRLSGGGGKDHFVLRPLTRDRDVITDFTHGTDVLEISSADFNLGLTPGKLPAGRLVTGSATDAKHQFIINFSSDGRDTLLFYDSDGSGAASGVLIATLYDVRDLTASDILVV